jgi:methylmalonyl-CoA/ethylmalonyl-CoA epimerase
MLTRIHHVGIVVRSLEEAYRFWRDTLGLAVHRSATVADQGVKAALLPCGETEIELLEPIAPEGGVAKFLAKRGEGLHHLCFEADDVGCELTAAKQKGLPLIDEVPRPGLAGMIGFLHPKASCGVLVEYATPPGPGGHTASEISVDHLAIVVDDVADAVATFRRNFGLRADGVTGSAPVRVPISRGALLFYPGTSAPPALGAARGLAGLGLRLSPDATQRARLGAGPGAGKARYGTTSHGVPLDVV